MTLVPQTVIWIIRFVACAQTTPLLFPATIILVVAGSLLWSFVAVLLLYLVIVVLRLIAIVIVIVVIVVDGGIVGECWDGVLIPLSCETRLVIIGITVIVIV